MLKTHMKVNKSVETLNKIRSIIQKKEPGAYLRFGDGDFMLAENRNDKMQTANTKLSLEMREAIGINGKNILKSIPLYCEKYGMNETHMFFGNHLLEESSCDLLLNIAKKYWNEDITDVYSHVALHYTSTSSIDECISFLNFLKLNNHIIIGNQNVPVEILKKLFGNDYRWIKTPDRNSYVDIDRIESEFDQVIDDSKYTVVTTFMGCSGRVMQKRIWSKHKNLFLFDFGSLMDAMCNWKTRGWINLTNFNHKNFLERI